MGKIEGASNKLISWTTQGKTLTGTITLPNGEPKKIEAIEFSARKNLSEKANFISKIFWNMRKYFESKTHVHHVEDSVEYRIEKKGLRKQLFHELFPNIGEKITEPEKNILEKKALKWIETSFPNTSTKKGEESFHTFSHKGHKFDVLMTQKGFDVGIQRKHLGQGSFKKVDEVFFLHADKSEAKVSVLKKKRAKVEMDREVTVSTMLKKAKVPHTLHMRKITNPTTGSTGALAELCDKGELFKLFPSLSPEQKLTILQQSATGLKGMHDLNLVHGDLKPENIVVTSMEDGLEAKLCDYGCVQKKGCEIPQGCGYGTFLYMAPEMYDQSKKREVSDKLDVFSFGCILYDALSQDTPLMEPEILFDTGLFDGEVEAPYPQSQQLGVCDGNWQLPSLDPFACVQKSSNHI